MYIQKRPSRGRGEYEIAEQYGRIGPHDLVDKDITIILGSIGPVQSGVVLKEQGHKLRLRLTNRHQIHLHRQITALLLLPKSIREEARLPGGQPTVMENRYLVSRIHFKEVSISGSAAKVAIDALDLSNGSQTGEEIKVDPRAVRIRRVVSQRSRFPDELSDLLGQFESLLASSVGIGNDAEDLVERIMEVAARFASDYDVSYTQGADVLPALEEILAIPEDSPQPSDVEQIPPEDLELRIREASRWRRWAVHRGSAGAKFRAAVRIAYHSTCIACGLSFPKNDYCAIAGVDAAHILPWSMYDLDLTNNGLCLCKLHHWAFDQALISLSFLNGQYDFKVTRRASRALGEHSPALDKLREVEGVVPDGLLPQRIADRPSPVFLQALNRTLIQE